MGEVEGRGKEDDVEEESEKRKKVEEESGLKEGDCDLLGVLREVLNHPEGGNTNHEGKDTSAKARKVMLSVSREQRA